MTRVLIVDDAAVFRRVIADILTELPDVEVVGTASNGKLALGRLPNLRPDLITLDIEMPEMNGIQFLEELSERSERPGAIVLSSVTRRGGQLTLRALELGAFDFITKPEANSPGGGVEDLRNRLIPMVKAFQRRREPRTLARPAIAQAPVPPPAVACRPRTANGRPIFLIGVSTGGPAALAQVLPGIPANFPSPIFIVQHMPPLFTEALAASLQARCSLKVKEAADNELAQPGVAYIAPGGRHMQILPGANGEILTKLTDDPPENNCRPAVDVLFRSAALHFPGRSVAAVMTGMGQDGTKGLKMLKLSGCFSIAQDEASSVVFGMPRAAIEAGVVDSVVPLQGIAAALVKQAREGTA